jgi:hypothetical protein
MVYQARKHYPLRILTPFCSAPSCSISVILGCSMTATFQLTAWILPKPLYPVTESTASFGILSSDWILLILSLSQVSGSSDRTTYIWQSPLRFWVCSQIAIAITLRLQSRHLHLRHQKSQPVYDPPHLKNGKRWVKFPSLNQLYQDAGGGTGVSVSLSTAELTVLPS